MKSSALVERAVKIDCNQQTFRRRVATHTCQPASSIGTPDTASSRSNRAALARRCSVHFGFVPLYSFKIRSAVGQLYVGSSES